MKQLVTILLLLIFSSSYTQNGGTWTWIHGDTISGSTGSYGVKGISSPNNAPPARYHPAYWQDLNGNFWMFGTSHGSTADMWMYNPSINEWVWVSGSNVSAGSAGNYGIKGIPSVTNYPANRGFGASCWTDSIGNLWLFSGNGQSDLWRYNPSTNEWTWMGGGSFSINSGLKNVPSISNFPGNRSECKSNWVHHNQLILFGGSNYNDVWSYDISKDMWTWIGGGGLPNKGLLGVPSINNNIKGGYSYTKWKKNDKVYLYAGAADEDVWEYDLNTNLFTWIYDASINSSLIPNNCLHVQGYKPKYSRFENHTVQTSKCNNAFWTYGGFKGLADLWYYHLDSNYWIRFSDNPSGIAKWGTKGIGKSSTHPGIKEGFAIWSDKIGNLYLLGGYTDRTNALWKFEPDPICLGGLKLTSSQLVAPKKKTICTPNDSVVMTIDKDWSQVSWTPSNAVVANADTSRLVFKPRRQTSYKIYGQNNTECGVGNDSLLFTVNIGSHSSAIIFDSTCSTTKYPYTQSGIYNYIIPNLSGCDSNINLNLISKNQEILVKHTLCQGEFFYFNSVKYITNTFKKFNYKNALNCDSNITLDLTFLPNKSTKIYDTFCQGDSVLFKGNYIKSNGTYKDSLKSSYGCDSILFHNYYFKPADNFTLYDTFCIGDTFRYMQYKMWNSGTYEYILKNRFGCDSIIKFVLASRPISLDTIKIDSIVFGNLCSVNEKKIYVYPLNSPTSKSKFTIDLSGFYQQASIFYNLTAGPHYIRIKKGCAMRDTIVTLPYKDRDTIKLDAAICSYDQYWFNDALHNQPGVYWDTFVNVSGCDSFHRLELSVYNRDTTKYIDTIKSGDSTWFQDMYYYDAGVYCRRYFGIHECDSIVQLKLTVLRRDTTYLNYKICYPDTIYNSGQKFTQDGNYVINLKNKINSDSFIFINIQVNYRDTIRKYDTICKGDSIKIEGVYYSKTGVYTYRYKNKYKCDSVIYRYLTVYPRDTIRLKYGLCSGDSLVYQGSVYKSSGTYILKYKNRWKCDSIVIIQLTISNQVLNTINRTICKGSQVDGYKLSGVYRDTFHRISTCDSVRELILTVNDTTSSNIQQYLCKYDTFTYNYKRYNRLGQYIDTSLNVNGCRHLTYINILPTNPIRTTSQVNLCSGKIYRGSSIPAVFYDTFLTARGCDSIDEVLLNISQPPIVNLDTTLCNGSSYKGHSQSSNFRDTILDGSGCQVIEDIKLKVLISPRHHDTIIRDCKFAFHRNKYYYRSDTFYDTTLNHLGCDSIYHHYMINIREQPKIQQKSNLVFCDSFIIRNQVYLSSFEYSDTIRTIDPMACDSIYQPLSYQMKESAHIKIATQPSFDEYIKGERVSIEASNALHYRWNTDDTLQSINIVLNEDRSFYVIGWNVDECLDTAYINLKVIDYAILDIPKAFAPNGNLLENQTFKPNFYGKITLNRFEIYNRVGEKIYSAKDLSSTGWDGRYKGELQPIGVYSYILEYKANRNQYFKTGEVLLVR